MGTDVEKDFFITYSSKDLPWPTWVGATLEAAGYSVVLQAWDFRAGENFMAHMDDALSRCRHAIGILSPSYLKSVFTRAEWTAAYRQALLGKDRAFIPVRVVRCEPAPLLGPIAYIDLVDVDEDEARQRLLDGVAPGRAPRVAPPFPGRKP